MNYKPIVEVITLCTIVILSVCSLSVNAEITNPFMAISTPLAFTPGTQFPIPITNGSIGFAQIGYYENATLVNDTWVFNHLQLDSQQTDLLSDSPTTANVNITAQNSNITITSFERLLTPDGSDINNTGSWLTAGWLNYTIAGVGKQVFQLQFDLGSFGSHIDGVGTSTWPIRLDVYIDGKEALYNTSWTTVSDDNGIIPYGVGVIVNGAASNVSISYAWGPIPAPASQSTGSSLTTTTTSSENSSELYLLIVAIAAGIIVPIAVFSNRHRLESMINKRIKRQQYPD